MEIFVFSLVGIFLTKSWHYLFIKVDALIKKKKSTCSERNINLCDFYFLGIKWSNGRLKSILNLFEKIFFFCFIVHTISIAQRKAKKQTTCVIKNLFFGKFDVFFKVM